LGLGDWGLRIGAWRLGTLLLTPYSSLFTLHSSLLTLGGTGN
jgi:hypothetical protein